MSAIEEKAAGVLDNLAEWKAATERGWSVVPLHTAGKKPLIRWKKYQQERASWEVVLSWLGQWRSCNLGVVTGEISGLVVLDVDGTAGQVSLSELGVLPRTPCVKTARGWHYYFRHPGSHVGNFAGELPGLDLRGDGGYVVGPGSVHESGHRYHWLVSPDECPPADMPQWLLDLVEGNSVAKLAPEKPQEARSNGAYPKSPDNGRAYAVAALAREARKVEDASDGTRHSRLLKSAIAVAGFVGILTEREIEEELYRAFSSRPFDRDYDARKTIRDGIGYGERRPREVPPPTPVSTIRLSPLPARHITVGAPEKGEEEVDEEWPGEGDEVPVSAEALAMLRDAPLTDAGNAECMAAVFGDMFRYDHNRKNGWMVWDTNRWVIDGDAAADRASLAIVRARQQATIGIEDHDRKKRAFSYLVSAENTSKRKGMLATAASLPTFATRIEQYDRNHWLVTTPQSTFDLQTGDVYEHRRDDLITMQLGTYYDAEATAPRWKRFLQEVFADDNELIAFIQRAVGYSLTGDTSEQCMFLCYGTGANGKSKFLEVLSALLGDYAGNAAFSTFDADRRTEATNDLAALRGKHLVTVIEADEDRRLAEARVKAVTGQDPITCRFLYCDPFTYTPTYKLWMAVNHKPTIRGTDRGIWRRIKLIPFKQSFEGTADDKHLIHALLAELPGILNWAFAGLREWHQNGLGTAAIVEAATEEYRRESDLVGQWFEDCCASSPADTTLAGDAYDSFRTWCKTFGFREPTQTSFGRTLDERGYKKIKLRGQRQYEGFLIVDPVTRRSEYG